MVCDRRSSRREVGRCAGGKVTDTVCEAECIEVTYAGGRIVYDSVECHLPRANGPLMAVGHDWEVDRVPGSNAPLLSGLRSWVSLSLRQPHDEAQSQHFTTFIPTGTEGDQHWGGHTATGDPIGEIEMYLFDGNESKGRATVVGPNGALEIEYTVRCD